MLIHGSEHPHHSKTFASILASFVPEDEGIMLISNRDAKTSDFTPSNFIFHKMRDFLWDRFSFTKNNFQKSRWDWCRFSENKWGKVEQVDLEKNLRCPPI